MNRTVAYTRSRLLWAVLAACALSVAGCSGSLEPKKIDYKSAGKLPPLDIPPDLTQPSGDDRYAVPDMSPSGTATYSSYARDRAAQPQQGTGIAPVALKEGARIERSGTQRWLQVPGTPEQVWPVVKDFWQELGFIVIVEKPETGIMETDWAENRAKIPQDVIRSTLGKVIDSWYSTAERDKFRTRLERTSDGMSTEIYLSHRGMVEVFDQVDVATGAGQRTVWQPRPADPELEAEMLSRLMTRFGVEEERARAMVTTAAGVERAKMVKDAAGGGMLVVNEPFDRAWRRVGLALDRVGFTVEDRDRASGMYYVRYVDPTKDETQLNKGILDKLMSWTSSDSKKAKPQQYRIEVKEAANATRVGVLSATGAPEKSEVGTRILSLLYDQLK
ncbi:MAG TPA: outer membrane protein assembly factor BamC [Burkholderiales bacterium]